MGAFFFTEVRVHDNGYDILGDNCIGIERNIPKDAVIGVMTGFIRNGKKYEADSRLYKLYVLFWTILGIIDMRQRNISFDDCRNRYGVGCSTITLIMNRFHECGKDVSALKQMSPSEVEELFYPPDNIRSKDSSIMSDYQEIYDRLSAPGSRDMETGLFNYTNQ